MIRIVLLLLALLLVAGCQPDDASGISFDEVSALEGDALSGEKLYLQTINEAPSCATCHSIEETRMVGPGLAGFADRAGVTVPGQSAEEYTFVSIVDPGDHVVGGYGNVMYAEYAEKLSSQEIADIMAYVLNL